jgi:hypothetical protein
MSFPLARSMRVCVHDHEDLVDGNMYWYENFLSRSFGDLCISWRLEDLISLLPVYLPKRVHAMVRSECHFHYYIPQSRPSILQVSRACC